MIRATNPEEETMIGATVHGGYLAGAVVCLLVLLATFLYAAWEDYDDEQRASHWTKVQEWREQRDEATS